MKQATPYSSLLQKLSRAKVRYIIVGVSGINFYSDNPGNMFATQDCDVLLEASAANVLAAIKIFRKEGYGLESNGEPLGPVDPWLAKKIMEHRGTVRAVKGKSLQVDLILDAGGIPYARWDRQKKTFMSSGVKIYVGCLPQLIKAKENSNREKDRKFLALYKIQLKEILKGANLKKFI